jgi:hypothetical protein
VQILFIRTAVCIVKRQKGLSAFIFGKQAKKRLCKCLYVLSTCVKNEDEDVILIILLICDNIQCFLF